MKIGKYKITLGLLGFAILGLVLLLVRESEGRVSAETKLNDLKYKMESAGNENASLILDLKNTIHDLETKIADSTAKHDAQMAEKASQVHALNNQLEEEAKKYEAMVNDKNAQRVDSEAKSKIQAEGLNQIIKAKSAQMNELGLELEKASARYVRLLKEKESLEAKTISLDADVVGMRRDLKKVQREKERLAQTILALTKKPETAHD